MSTPLPTPLVELHPWSDADLPVLLGVNTPELTRFIGGPETAEKLTARHARYLRDQEPGTTVMFTIRLPAGGNAVGSVGYWARKWRDETIYETGWSILPGFQGRGLATAGALALIARLRAGEARLQVLHAFPSPKHAASNAICRKTGFKLLGECDGEYPPGNPVRSNDWCLDLLAP